MPRQIVGVEPVQLAYGNPKRKRWIMQFLPTSIEAGNTGLIYVKRGSAPAASAGSNTWDQVLNSGSGAGDNMDDAQPECPWKGDVWAISDTAGQVITILETNVEEKPTPT